MHLKNKKSGKNIYKRGNVKKSLVVIYFCRFLKVQKKEDDMPIGPVLLGLFLFVVVGSGKDFEDLVSFQYCLECCSLCRKIRWSCEKNEKKIVDFILTNLYINFPVSAINLLIFFNCNNNNNLTSLLNIHKPESFQRAYTFFADINDVFLLKLFPLFYFINNSDVLIL